MSAHLNLGSADATNSSMKGSTDLLSLKESSFIFVYLNISQTCWAVSFNSDHQLQRLLKNCFDSDSQFVGQKPNKSILIR